MTAPERVLAALVALLALPGCSPESLTVTDTDVVITVRDLDRSYAAYETYALPDAIIDVCTLPTDAGAAGAGGAAGAAGAAGASSADGCVPLDHTYDQAILDAIRRNLDRLGFEEVEQQDSPDVLLLPAAVAQESWYVYDGYCGYWYGYCFDYAWERTAVSYPLGTLAMYMLSWKDADAGRAPVIWLGVISGLMTLPDDDGNHALDADRIDTNVDQAFDQSAYLGEGK